MLLRRPLKKNPKKPYGDRTDIEKLRSNWIKTLALHKRKEFSMAIIRASTCAEIAANIAIRGELMQKRHLKKDFVDSLMIWANGVKGKFEKLLMPATKGSGDHTVLKKHKNEALKLNDIRNQIAHSGRFADHKTSHKLLMHARSLCTGIARVYGHDITLEKPLNYTRLTSRRNRLV